VAKFSGSDILQKSKWEASASNEVYPHFYGFDLLIKEVRSFCYVTEQSECPGVENQHQLTPSAPQSIDPVRLNPFFT